MYAILVSRIRNTPTPLVLISSISLLQDKKPGNTHTTAQPLAEKSRQANSSFFMQIPFHGFSDERIPWWRTKTRIIQTKTSSRGRLT